MTSRVTYSNCLNKASVCVAKTIKAYPSISVEDVDNSVIAPPDNYFRVLGKYNLLVYVLIRLASWKVSQVSPVVKFV